MSNNRKIHIFIDGSGSFFYSSSEFFSSSEKKLTPFKHALDAAVEQTIAASKKERNTKTSIWGVSDDFPRLSSQHPEVVIRAFATGIDTAMNNNLSAVTVLMEVLEKVEADYKTIKSADDILAVIITDGDVFDIKESAAKLQTLFQAHPNFRLQFIVAPCGTLHLAQVTKCLAPLTSQSGVKMVTCTPESIGAVLKDVVNDTSSNIDALAEAQKDIVALRTLFAEAQTRLEKLEEKLGGKKPLSGNPSPQP